MTKKRIFLSSILFSFLVSCGASGGGADRCKGACTASQKCVNTIVETTDSSRCWFGTPCLVGVWSCADANKPTPKSVGAPMSPSVPQVDDDELFEN